MNIIGLTDWGIWLVYLVLIGLVMYFYKSSKSNQEIYKYFMPAFLLKVGGGFIFALIYVFYYKGGDSIEYFNNSSILAEAFSEDPTSYFKLIFSQSGSLPADLSSYTDRMGYSRGNEEWFTVRLLSVFNFLGFKSYLITTLLISVVSFFCGWKLFLVFVDRVDYKKLAFYAVFLTPSVIFWGSGILKDTLVLASLSLMIWLFYEIMYKKRRRLLYLALFFLFSYLTFRFKSYVLILFLPVILIGLYSIVRESMKNVIMKFLTTPILIGGLIFFAYSGFMYLTAASSKYKLNGLEKKVKGFHSWHTDQGGSVYSLGEIEYTVSGVIKKIPAAWNVTMFRPYLWEAGNLVMILGALESIVCLFLFLRLLIFRFRNISFLWQDSILLMMFIYILTLGFVVGFTSYNFGALARYKIPIMSMFVFVLLVLNYDSKYSKQKKIK